MRDRLHDHDSDHDQVYDLAHEHHGEHDRHLHTKVERAVGKVKSSLRRMSSKFSRNSPSRRHSNVSTTSSDASSDFTPTHALFPSSSSDTGSSDGERREDTDMLRVVKKSQPEASNKANSSPARRPGRLRQRLSSLSFTSSSSSSTSTPSTPPSAAFPRHPYSSIEVPLFGRKKRSRTASDSALPVAMSSASTPATPPPVVEEGQDVDPFVAPDDSPISARDAPSQFLIEDPDESEPPTPLPTIPEPARDDTPDVSPAHELLLESPPSPSASVDINKPVPPAPPSETSTESEPDAPAIYLPQLVVPTMFLPIPNTDPLSTLLTKYVANPEKRPPRDTTGEYTRADFHTLVMTNSWRALARMARDRLVQTDPEDLERVFSLWYLRLASLARLRLFNQTSTELQNLFGALVSVPRGALDRVLPFELEVLAARVPYWSGDAPAYADALAQLLLMCRTKARRARNAADRGMWVERGARVGLITASHFIETKDYAAATATLEPLLAQPQPGFALRAAVGRVYLQAGQLDRAAAHFALVDDDPDAPASTKKVNAALLASARGEWARAAGLLREVVDDNPQEFVAVNDLAVALLSEGKIKEGIDVLEAALRVAPSALAMAEPFLFNLSTLYELRSAAAADKKRDLLVEVAKWSGDGLRTTCLKLPAS